ncbi:MAG: hypothetical protein OEM23_02845 [Gemmatimonadota bacterium]|nr:hypothetical protein [Gemmatimonadota bacterium]MDH3427350.1 hypothetical protein [Gemmatimonadota bacterium]
MNAARQRMGVARTAVLCLLGLSACGGDPGAAADVSSRLVDGTIVCQPPVHLAALPAELHEASGIARDPRRAGLFWVHNDGGNEPELYAIDLTGAVLAVVPVVGATLRDLEDVAAGTCPEGDCLYLADIGDNLAVRTSVAVHRVPLPGLPGSLQADDRQAAVEPDVSWRLVYEDGARDAESLAIDSRRSELVVVSKGRNGEIVLYAVPIAALHDDPAEPDTLRRVGRLPLPIGANSGQFVTAADLSPDASLLAVRSYTTLYLFPWEGSATFDSVTAPPWVSLIAAREAQGEGISWDVSGDGMILVSEGRRGIAPSVSQIRCRAGALPTE